MSIGVQYSYVINDDVTVDMSLFGEDLVITADRTLVSGFLTHVSLFLNYSEEIESYGVEDFEMISITSEPMDVTANDPNGTSAQAIYLASVLMFAAAKQELDEPGHIGTVISDMVGTKGLFGSDLADHMTLGGDGRSVRLLGGDDIAHAAEGAGAMTWRMGSGDDSAYGGGGDDTIYGGRGDDQLEGGDGDDALNGGRGADVIVGQAGENLMRGALGNDVILGGEDNDTLKGDAGHDVLVGSGGRDLMQGGADSDAFVFLLGGTEQIDGWTGVILDFEQGEDKLWMSPTGNSTYNAEDAFALFSAHAVQRGNSVLLRDEGDWRLIIRDAQLTDFTVEDFIDGAQNIGIYQWADTLG